MPGLGVITQRVTGETIDATKYNGDRQELVNMMEPAQIDDYSASTLQSNETLDPGIPTAENLAVNLRDEVKQLRFMLGVVTGAGWRTQTRTLTELVPLVTSGGAIAGTLSHGVVGSVYAVWRVPERYASGNVNFFYTQRCVSTSGVFNIQHTIFRFRDLAPIVVLLDVNASGPLADTNSHAVVRVITSTDFTVGDFIRFEVRRVGTDASDTNTGALSLDAFYVTYTGFVGRN
jgi:hypothetical protein